MEKLRFGKLAYSFCFFFDNMYMYTYVLNTIGKFLRNIVKVPIKWSTGKIKTQQFRSFKIRRSSAVTSWTHVRCIILAPLSLCELISNSLRSLLTISSNYITTYLRWTTLRKLVPLRKVHQNPQNEICHLIYFAKSKWQKKPVFFQIIFVHQTVMPYYPLITPTIQQVLSLQLTSRRVLLTWLTLYKT